MAEEEKRVNVAIPKTDHTALRVLCVNEGVDFLRLVPAIIHQALAEPEFMGRAVEQARRALSERAEAKTVVKTLAKK